MRADELERAGAVDEADPDDRAPRSRAVASASTVVSASPSEAQAALALFDDVLERGSPPRWRVGAGAAIVLVLVAAAIAVAMAALRPSGAMTLPASTTSPPAAGAFGSAGAGASTTPSAATILVHVLGAVRAPGVYELPAGSRLVDAVAAAGGLSDDADPSLVNLARTLVDGEQARIPRVGEPAPSEPAAGASGDGSTGGAGAGASGGSSGTASALVNLNTATQAELETLPRIGPAMAQRILDYRAQHGGFTSVEDLRNVSGIGDATYEQLAPLVTV